MAITSGQDILASDFIKDSERNATPSNDTGRAIKLEANGYMHSGFINVLFGNGSDGSVDVDGTNTFSFLTKSGSDYTMDRDIYCTDLIVPSGSTLDTNGYKIFVQDTLSGVGKIFNNGVDGTNGTSGAGGGAGGAGGTASGTGPHAAPAGTTGGAGNASGSGANGTNGTASVSILDGAAGGGGGEGSGANTPSDGGTVGTNNATHTFGIFQTFTAMLIDIDSSDGSMAQLIASTASTGGGGGGSAGGGNAGAGGGGGGSSAGAIIIFARRWTGTFTIEGIGGDGGDGGVPQLQGGSGGGGGAGNGATVVVFYGTKTWTGTSTLTAGTGGIKQSETHGNQAAVAGANGVTGTLYEFEAKELL